jgi:signal transduction histidine kinase
MLERHADSVVLVVEDDGVGFDPPSMDDASLRGGFGLLGMQERAALVGATLHIESTPHRGTTVLLRMTTTAPARNTADHA